MEKTVTVKGAPANVRKALSLIVHQLAERQADGAYQVALKNPEAPPVLAVVQWPARDDNPPQALKAGDVLAFTPTEAGAGWMVADAQGWLDNAATNFGWEIIGDETMAGTGKRFGSRESSILAERPVLIVTFTPASCYANCDGSTTAPILNVNDFTCFLNRYAAADSYANCDGSTTAPVLNVNDFTCFLNRYAAGCT